MNGLWIALGFLSRVPAPGVEFTLQGLARSLFWFPAVGVLLGLAWWGALAGLSSWLSPTLLGFVMVVIGVLFTGALHLDGVADTFDGFSASGGGKERALAAMKDSRIGAHGAVALVLVLFGKWTAFQNLHAEFGAVVCTGAAVIARLACAVVVAAAKPARSSGLGATFAGVEARITVATARPGVKSAWLGSLWLVVPGAMAGGAIDRWVALALAAFATVVGIAFFVRHCIRCFGGVTGDTHGALIEVGETLLLLVGAACSSRLG